MTVARSPKSGTGGKTKMQLKRKDIVHSSFTRGAAFLRWEKKTPTQRGAKVIGKGKGILMKDRRVRRGFKHPPDGKCSGVGSLQLLVRRSLKAGLGDQEK